MPRPRVYDQALRRSLIDAAGRLLVDEGPAAVTLRRVADQAGTSTSAVYALFGSKAGLVREMFLEGHRRMAEVFATVEQTDDPMADLIALGLAYRANALANPHLYAVMFGRPIAEFAPDAQALAQTSGTFVALVRAIERAQAAGRIVTEASELVAIHLWGLTHGLASLELLGGANRREWGHRWASALSAAARGYAPSPSPSP